MAQFFSSLYQNPGYHYASNRPSFGGTNPKLPYSEVSDSVVRGKAAFGNRGNTPTATIPRLSKSKTTQPFDWGSTRTQNRDGSPAAPPPPGDATWGVPSSSRGAIGAGEARPGIGPGYTRTPGVIDAVSRPAGVIDTQMTQPLALNAGPAFARPLGPADRAMPASPVARAMSIRAGGFRTTKPGQQTIF